MGAENLKNVLSSPLEEAFGRLNPSKLQSFQLPKKNIKNEKNVYNVHMCYILCVYELRYTYITNNKKVTTSLVPDISCLAVFY